MYHQMENAFAHVEVDELGAQLHSLRRRKDGYEYLWQGDPAIWPGQAPILFPIVGTWQRNAIGWAASPIRCLGTALHVENAFSAWMSQTIGLFFP